LLCVPLLSLLVWRAFIMISGGDKPFVDREYLKVFLRIIDAITVLLLWLWLLYGIYRHVEVTDDE
jgi:hypothetical protein